MRRTIRHVIVQPTQHESSQIRQTQPVTTIFLLLNNNFKLFITYFIDQYARRLYIKI